MNDITTPPHAGFEFRRLRRLLDAAILLNSTLELKELTEIILEIVRDQVPVERVTAFRVDRERQLVCSLVAQEVQQEISLPIGLGIAGVVAATGEVLDIPDAYADPRFNSRFDRLLNYRTRDLLALPIVNRQGDVVGVLELLNRSRPISPTDLEFLQGVSIYMGLALENAWLYQEALSKERIERELVRLRHRLAHLERLSTMAQVLSGVVHEINNPLAIAMGNVGLLKVGLAADDKSLRHLQKIESAVDRAATVARRFVNFTEAQTGQYQPVDVGKLLGQVVELRAAEWKLLGIESTVNVQQAPPVFGDEGQLQLVLMHLIINAEEASLKKNALAHIRIRLSHDSNQVRVEIEDNGPDIPPETQKRLFEPFFTTKAAGSGTGVGLATVRAVAEKHGGRVSFATTIGQGTTFIIALPAFVAARVVQNSLGNQ